MTTPTNDHTRRHGGWQRRRVHGREALLRTAKAPEPAAAEAAEAQWLDDGGTMDARGDSPALRHDSRRA